MATRPGNLSVMVKILRAVAASGCVLMCVPMAAGEAESGPSLAEPREGLAVPTADQAAWQDLVLREPAGPARINCKTF